MQHLVFELNHRFDKSPLFVITEPLEIISTFHKGESFRQLRFESTY
jgi:hypothetical protein